MAMLVSWTEYAVLLAGMLAAIVLATTVAVIIMLKRPEADETVDD
jgi:MFS superfamily sulfate permease-like transporter